MFLSLLHPRRFFSFSPYRWLSVLSFAAGLASAPILRADEREPWWEYAYTGDALPPESEPPWSVVEPKIKSGMVIKDSVVDGNLLMSYTGNRVVHYYNIGFSDGRFVWTTTSSKDGNTVEFRARAADAVPGVPYVALFALTGFGDEKRKAGYVMLGPNGVHAFGQAVPIDAAEFHVYRVVADPQAQSFSLHVDGDPSPVASASWDDLPDELPSERLFFGGTYASSFQGTLELDYLAWTNRAAIVPDGSTPQAPASQPKKEQASAPVPAEPRKTSVPVDLSDPDIARVDQLFRNFDRFFRVAVPRSVIKPVIDGKVETAEWKDASQFTGLVAANEPGAFWVKHDPDTVYLAFQLERSAGPPARASTTGRSEDVWSSEDGVELMFSPDKERKTVASLYLNANSGYAEGTSLEGAAMDLSWKGNWTLKSRVTGRGIEGEVAIPKSQFDAFLSEHHLPPDTASWGFNAMWVDLSPAPAQADLTDMWSSGGYDGAFMGSLDFISDRAGVQVETIGALDGDRIGFRGMLRNGESRPLRAKLRYAIYRATRDVRKNKINFFETWDKVHRIRTTDSDVDEGAAVQLFLGENTWLKNLGQAYELVAEETLDLDVPAGRQVPFEAGVNQPSGQFIAAIRLTDSDGGRVLWSQTLPFEIRSEFDLHLTKRFLTAGGVAVRFDGSGSSSLQKGDELKAALVDGKTGRVLDRWDAWFEDKTIPLEHFFAMTGLPPGSYTLDASVVNAEGKTIVTRKVDFQKPPKPDWLGNRIGYSDKVPWPFTPVEAAPGQVSIWGRTYTWASHNAFPAQIVTQGNTLLARPIELELVSRGIRLPWKTKEWKLASSAPRTAVYEAVMEGGPFALTLQITVDFDGFMRFKGELKGAGVPLDSLKLIVPVRKEWVSYFHAAQFETIPELVNANYKAGSLAAFKKEFPAGATPFAGIFWLGGPRGGIQWIAEWDRGWRNPDRKNVMRLVEGKDDVALEVSIIGERTTLTEPLPVDFAFNVSPVREWSYYWTISTANGGSDALYPQNYDPQRLRSDLQKAKDAGITHVIHGGFGWPFHADVWVRGHNRPHFKENVATVHEMGLEYIFYGCWGYSSNGEESADFGADMMKVPLQPAGTDTYWYNPEGPWVDFFMAGLDTAIQEYGVDGIYLDSMANTMLCADPLAGQTFTDEQGRVHGKWTTFALRDWALRLQNVMHIDPLKKGLVYQHDSGAPNLAIVSLADIRCGGEDAPSTYSLRESWPLDSYLARFDMHTFGIPQETLWYNWWKRPLKENQVMAVPLLHGQMKNRDPGTYLSAINPDYELNTKPQIRILRVYQDFDIPHAEWWPYYREDNWISLNPGSLCASSYLHRGKKALVVVANLDAEAVTAKVTLDLAKAGFDGSSVIVTDALLGGTIPVTGDTFDLEIQPERYRLLLIEAPLADSPTTP